MSLDRLRAAVDGLDEGVDPVELRRLIDALEMKFCQLVWRAKQRAEHSGHGFATTTGWLATACGMSATSVGDRLCVGEQLDSMPAVVGALSNGDIGYQAAAVICHLRERLGDKAGMLDERQWIGHARNLSIKDLRYASQFARHLWDPEGFDRDSEEDYDRRYLHVSEMRGMYRLDGMLDAEGGVALKTAIDSLAKRLGPDDVRTNGQRRADVLVEMAHHAMDEGTLPRRHGVRPHVTVTTTAEALQGEAGAPASELEGGIPISSKTAQRLACSGTLTRVVKAGSVVVDVGRATRTVSPAQWRALKARHRGCAWTGCDRPINWTSPHHIEFWGRGGKTNLPNLLPVCHFHHRLVHEGGWHIVKAGEGLKFVPPDRVAFSRARAPGIRRAA